MPEPSSIGRIIRRRVKKRVCYRLARMVYPVVLAVLDQFPTEEPAPEPDSAEDKQRLDLTGTTGGQFEVAANRDHATDEVIAGRPFGFGPPGR